MSSRLVVINALCFVAVGILAGFLIHREITENIARRATQPRVLVESLSVGQPGVGIAAVRDSLRAHAGTLKDWQERTTFKWSRKVERHYRRLEPWTDVVRAITDTVELEMLAVVVSPDSGCVVRVANDKDNIPDSVVTRLAEWLAGLTDTPEQKEE